LRRSIVTGSAVIPLIPLAHLGPHNLLEWLIYGGLLVALGGVAVALLHDPALTPPTDLSADNPDSEPDRIEEEQAR
jgi:hypothetical protein